MRADGAGRLPGLIVVAMAIAGACGRVGYDPVAIIDAGAGAGGRGGSLGTGGSSGRGGSVGGRGGAAGSATGVGGSATGTGAAAGTGGAGGDGGAGGSAAGVGGGAGGTDGGAPISCVPQTYGGHNYLFCEPLVPWATARAECEQRGMRLARIDDSLENGWLMTTAVTVFSAPMNNREALWLGGFEPTSDGDWHWTDGAPFWTGGISGMAVGGLYTNWDNREPNNAVGPEACLSIPLNQTTWYDYACDNLQFFACEMY
jgi:hypothetical protein